MTEIINGVIPDDVILGMRSPREVTIPPCKHAPFEDGTHYVGFITTCKFCGIKLVYANPAKGKVNMSKKERRKLKLVSQETRDKELEVYGRVLTSKERNAYAKFIEIQKASVQKEATK